MPDENRSQGLKGREPNPGAFFLVRLVDGEIAFHSPIMAGLADGSDDIFISNAHPNS
jgi:hypothetical protein